jgi:hypothetical protein
MVTTRQLRDERMAAMYRKTLRSLLLVGTLIGLVDGAEALTATRLSTSLAASLSTTDQTLVYATHPAIQPTDSRLQMAIDPAIVTSSDPTLTSLDPRVALLNPMDSMVATTVASGPGWVRSRITGVPLPELTINGVAIPADHFITIYGQQGIASFDLAAMTGIHAPPFSDKLKQRLAAHAATKLHDADRVYALYEPALLLALGRDRVAHPSLYQAYGTQVTYLNRVIDFMMDNLLLQLCGPALVIQGFEMSPGCGGSGGSGGSGGLLDWFGDLAEDVEDWLSECADYEEAEKPWNTTVTAQVFDGTTGAFDTVPPITAAYDGSLEFSVRVSSATDPSKGIRLAASGKIRYGQVLCVPVWFAPTEFRLAADAAVETLMKVNGIVKSDISKTFDNLEHGPATVPLFITTFSIGPVPVLVFVEFVAEVGIATSIAAGSQPVHVAGGLWGGAGLTVDVACTPSGCGGGYASGTPGALVTDPITADVTSSGRATIRPYIYPSLRALVLVGPAPLMGQIGPRLSTHLDIWAHNGLCGDANQDGVEEEAVGLTLDLDLPILDIFARYGLWSIPGLPDWVGNLTQSEAVLATLLTSHFGFWDLTDQIATAGGTRALSPIVAGPASPQVGVPASYTAMMRPCYPYPDRVTGAIAWGDGTTFNWSGDRQAGVAVPKTWTGPGPYTVVARPWNDTHGRQFGDAAEYRTTRTVAPVADTTGPAIANLTDSPDAFVPSRREVSTISFTVADDTAATCSATVRISVLKTTLYSKSFAGFRCRFGSSLSAVWDGRDAAGNLVAPGTYTYRVTATDAAGNTSTATGTITVRAY